MGQYWGMKIVGTYGGAYGGPRCGAVGWGGTVHGVRKSKKSMKWGQKIKFLKSTSEVPIMFSMSFVGILNPEKNYSGICSRFFRYFSDHLRLKK